MNDFDGLVAVVTGGASRIGQAVAHQLAARGARVAVLDLKDTEFVCDVADDVTVRAAVEAVAVRYGRIDIVVNNAGIGAQGTVEDNTDAEWLRVFDVNVVGIARVTRAALPYLRQSPSAAVVNTCSIAATAG